MSVWVAQGWKRKEGWGTKVQGLHLQLCLRPCVQGSDGEGEGQSRLCRASTPTGKTDGEEVLRRVMSSANEKHGVLWEPLLGDREPDSSGGEWERVGMSL